MRVFVGIDLDEDTARQCAGLQAWLPDLPGRRVQPQDMHITLVPPWNVQDLEPVEERLAAVARQTKPFPLALRRLAYGPTRQRPRLAWIECEPVEELRKLRDALADAFQVEDRRDFRPHITIARFRKEHWKSLKAHPIERQLSVQTEVTSITLFESVHRGDTTYRILGAFPFSR